MNRKAESSFGYIILAAVAILIGLAFYSGSVTPSIGTMTQLVDSRNTSFILPAVSTTTELTACGQRAPTVILINASGGQVVPTTNYTISQAPGTDGFLSAQIRTAAVSAYASQPVNLSCIQYERKGYVPDGAGRTIIGLIAVFSALLILIAAFPRARDSVIDFFKG